MDPFGIALGVGALSAGASWFNRREQADLMRRQTDEEVRRLRVSQAQKLSAVDAAGAASGIELDSSSLQAHTSAMSAEFDRQAEWMRRAGYAGARATDTAANFGAISDFGGALFQYGANSNWFKTPGLPPPTYQPGQGMPPYR